MANAGKDWTPKARPSVYLAGPEVFLPNALEVGRKKQAICAEAGLDGLFPLDAQLDLTGLDKTEQARRIALGNEGLMRRADAIIANMTPFRGVSMDAGTAYEIGFMRALGRPVFAYTNAGPADYRARAAQFSKCPRLPFDCDRPGFELEDFGLIDNLMMAVAVGETPAELVTHAADADMADLTAFCRCVAQARERLAS